jgi:hypothetical protein
MESVNLTDSRVHISDTQKQYFFAMRRKAEILNEQDQKRGKMAEIVGLVEGLRSKSDWITKIRDQVLRDKYCAEAVDQGISLASMNKALGILDTMANCLPSPILNLSASAPAPIPEEAVVVQVGDVLFPTTTQVLIADSESMLNRMFSPPWFRSLDGEAVKIETTTNSPVIFAHILTYLEALHRKSNNCDLCPNIHSLTFEEISQLHHDCSYLGLRRLSIALAVSVFVSEVDVANKQRASAEALSQATFKLRSLKSEKETLEKRLIALPDLIAEAEREEQECQSHRELFETRWRGEAGDVIEVNTSANTWTKCSLVAIDGVLIAEPIAKRRFHSEPAPSANPIPAPAYYHPISSIFTEKAQALHVDHLLPQLLAESLEQHLDNLLHEKSLDLHPGSEGHVADLIHPSVCPYIKGLTQVSDEIAFEECEKVVGDYSWLPAEVSVDHKGVVSIESYINNLDERTHGDLYFDIAQVFQTMLPMFEHTLSRSLKSSNLQVIVKAAYYFIPPGETYSGAVILSLSLLSSPPFLPRLPSLPSSQSGSWHVEGMKHEHIIASGIYYVSVSHNIDRNHLAFRTLIDETTLYEEQGYPGQEVPLVNDLGKVDTPTGRALVWQNHIQHRVGGLTVPPTSVTGIRKILCFFLVDPAHRIVSTKIVPPQQGVIPLEVAMEHRQQLMNERKYKADRDAEDWEERVFTFCEH